MWRLNASYAVIDHLTTIVSRTRGIRTLTTGGVVRGETETLGIFPSSSPLTPSSTRIRRARRLRVRRAAQSFPFRSADYDSVKSAVTAADNVHYWGNVEARVFTLLPIERCGPDHGERERERKKYYIFSRELTSIILLPQAHVRR